MAVCGEVRGKTRRTAMHELHSPPHHEYYVTTDYADYTDFVNC